MQKRKKNYFLHSVLCLALLQLSAAAATAFQYDICINGADSPSLTFGVGVQEQQPAPPYSGMFGVIDIHLMNVKEVSDEDPNQKWMKRLTKDIRTDTEMSVPDKPQAWYIFAKNNASLKFNLTSGTPESLLISDVTENNHQVVRDGMTLPVKTGKTYKIFYKDREPNTPVPKDENVIIVENNDAPPVARPITNTILQTIKKIFVDFNAGIGSIGYDGEPLNITPDWIVKISRGSATVKYNWLIRGKRLEVTLTVTTRAAGDMEIVMTPKKQNIPPVETLVIIPDTEEIVDTAQWIPKAYGTIDFDGDGDIDINDAMYFYNFVQNECPSPSNEDITEAELEFFIPKNEIKNTSQVWQTMYEGKDNLNLDGEGGINLTDAMYLYNFIQNECPAQDSDDVTPAELEFFIVNPQRDKTNTAWTKMSELYQNSISK